MGADESMLVLDDGHLTLVGLMIIAPVHSKAVSVEYLFVLNWLPSQPLES